MTTLRDRQLKNVGMTVLELQDMHSVRMYSRRYQRCGRLTLISRFGSSRAYRVAGRESHYFTLLGAKAALGRVFGPEEDSAQVSPKES